MSKRIILVVATVILFVVAYLIIAKKVPSRNSALTNPGVMKVFRQSAVTVTPTPVPAVINKPPEEIHYGSSTDLKEVLNSINPQVLESDFSE